jgi:DNA topoisomerase-2
MRFSFETVSYNQGFDKTFDEILVNAYDHAIRTRGSDCPLKTIKVKVDAESGEISVENDGQGIPIEMTDFGCYTPELIFGTLLTSSNYDDKEERLTAGRNGYGAKLTNLFLASSSPLNVSPTVRSTSRPGPITCPRRRNPRSPLQR